MARWNDAAGKISGCLGGHPQEKRQQCPRGQGRGVWLAGWRLHQGWHRCPLPTAYRRWSRTVKTDIPTPMVPHWVRPPEIPKSAQRFLASPVGGWCAQDDVGNVIPITNELRNKSIRVGPCWRAAALRGGASFRARLSPASRRGQTRGCPKVSRVVITLPRPRRVEDNAPYRLNRLSLGIGITYGGEATKR